VRLSNAVAQGFSPVLSVRIALALVRSYQLIVRPFLTGSCRYLPTCSEYAAEAIVTYGALKGAWIGLKRVMRCHPLGGSGFDPVPIESTRVADSALVVPTFRSATKV
jgi:hypothetical protein